MSRKLRPDLSYWDVALTWYLRIALPVVVLLLVAVFAGFRVNVSRSLPLGIYKTTAGSSVGRGSIIIVCLPADWARFAQKREILGPGTCEGGTYGLGKVVLAVAGDVVEVRPTGVIVNGKSVPDSRPEPRDRHGRAMPLIPAGEYVLEDDELWLFSPYHRAAFDSRYFGPVSTSRVQSVITPVITSRAETPSQW